jgi:SAM-dependent methyltransferase
MEDAYSNDHDFNAKFYTEKISEFGQDVRSLNWGSRESQSLRFAVLAGIGDLNGASVLDIGCGLGDFYQWMKEQNYAPDYSGIDITPKMVELCKERFPEADFHVGPILGNEALQHEGYDYLFASGIFYLQKEAPQQYMERTVAAMFGKCNMGIAFNNLSNKLETEETEFRADPAATFAFCQTITPWVNIRHDYHLGDFTIFMYRERNL